MPSRSFAAGRRLRQDPDAARSHRQDLLRSDSVHLQYDRFVDFFVCGSELECHRDHLRLDDDYVRILTLQDPTAKTYSDLIASICNTIASSISLSVAPNLNAIAIICGWTTTTSGS